MLNIRLQIIDKAMGCNAGRKIMKRFIYASALVALIATLAVFENRAAGQTPAADAPDQHRAMLNTYCVGCHNTRVKTGGLALDDLNLQAAADDAQI